MPAWFNAIWPVALFFLGQASTFLSGSINEKRQIARETKARQAEREKVVTERRETFELDHLQRLNEALQNLGRAAGSAHVADLRVARETGHYGGALLGADISDVHHQANRDVHMLRNLVLDEGLRTQLARTQSALNDPNSLVRATPQEGEQRFHEAMLMLNDAQDAIAARIREIYQTTSLAERRA